MQNSPHHLPKLEYSPASDRSPPTTRTPRAESSPAEQLSWEFGSSQAQIPKHQAVGGFTAAFPAGQLHELATPPDSSQLRVPSEPCLMLPPLHLTSCPSKSLKPPISFEYRHSALTRGYMKPDFSLFHPLLIRFPPEIVLHKPFPPVLQGSWRTVRLGSRLRLDPRNAFLLPPHGTTKEFYFPVGALLSYQD